MRAFWARTTLDRPNPTVVMAITMAFIALLCLLTAEWLSFAFFGTWSHVLAYAGSPTYRNSAWARPASYVMLVIAIAGLAARLLT